MLPTRVLLLGPHFQPGSRWIDDFCARPDLQFTKWPFAVPVQDWHQRGGTTPIAEWATYLRYARTALRTPCECVVTLFPPLAAAAAALLRLQPARHTPLVAWNFNLGSHAGWLKGRLAGAVLRRVDRFVVHTRGEIDGYAGWLGVDAAKLRFVPLQSGRLGALPPSPIEPPYIVSMGSAHRDYRTLLQALRGTGIRTVLIAGPQLLEALPRQDDVIALHGLSRDQCHAILAGAELNVVPIDDAMTAAGQVTFTRSLRMGIATIATRCIGTVDYLRDGDTGVLVPPGDAVRLREAIVGLWNDRERRARIARAGYLHAARELSDEAAGQRLGEVIDDVLGRRSAVATDAPRPGIEDRHG